MQETGSLVNVLWAFVFIATGGLLFGYIIGINSNVITEGQLLCPHDYTGSVGTWRSWGYGQCYHLTPVAKGILSSLNLLGACASSLVCFRYADVIGRKLEMQIAGLCYLGGAVVAAAMPVLWGLFLGFLIYGLGVGFAMHAAPVYIAEISPAAVRGMLVSAKEAVIVLGIFLGFLSGYAFSYVGSEGWRLMISGSGLLALVMLCGIMGLPQSPRFLVLQAVLQADIAEDRADDKDKLRAEAVWSLQFFRRGTAEAAEEELQALMKDLSASFKEEGSELESLLPGGAKQSSWLGAFSYRRPMVVGCGLVLLQQVTGQPSVLYFATNIFKAAGFGHSASMQAVGIGLIKLLATLFTVWKVDDYGRRNLLFVGILMMSLALALLAASFCHSHCQTPHTSLKECAPGKINVPKGWSMLTVIAFMLYVSGYQVGFGPIAWLMISEVFPLRVRGSALSIAAIVNFASNIGMTVATPVLLYVLKPTGLFVIFLCLAFSSLIFVQLLVPETRGKSLEEIEAIMKS